jgi:DNA-binding Xre family transcriptional regulator
MPRQRDLARETGLHQSRISVFETPGAANVTLETLANIAAGLKVGLIVKFVPFSEMLDWENSYSQDTFNVFPRLEEDEAFLNPTAANTTAANTEPAGTMIAASESGINDLAADERKQPASVHDFGSDYPDIAGMASQQAQLGGL